MGNNNFWFAKSFAYAFKTKLIINLKQQMVSMCACTAVWSLAILNLAKKFYFNFEKLVLKFLIYLFLNLNFELILIKNWIIKNDMFAKQEENICL